MGCLSESMQALAGVAPIASPVHGACGILRHFSQYDVIS